MKTTKSQIIDYWKNSPDFANGDEMGMGVDQADLDADGGRCWRCATTENVQRCHIVASSQGGADEPSNYVLLCKTCHDDAPMVSNCTAEDFFIWIKESRKSLENYLAKNTESGFGIGMSLASYPPVGQRGNYWNLRVVQIAMQNWGFDIAKEKNELTKIFIDMLKEEVPNLIDEDSDEYVRQMFKIINVFHDISYIIDLETQVGIHMQQESGRLSEAKFSSEALANIKNIKNLKSLINLGKESFKNYVNSMLEDEEVVSFNKDLGFNFFEPTLT